MSAAHYEKRLVDGQFLCLHASESRGLRYNVFILSVRLEMEQTGIHISYIILVFLFSLFRQKDIFTGTRI